ncbi:hypothetical protein [Corallococcus sp. RDP092CA]|uniref:hypothetical protein n=1 Tax=Corallococcus sp. RDP092CA TaxID=3109369 RepID=UPI0035B4AF49
MKNHVSPRPPYSGGAQLVYDCKSWSCCPSPGALTPTADIAEMLACLYWVSQVGDIKQVTELVNGGSPFDVRLFGPIDADVKGVVDKAVRFRAALAEHLAFWVSLGSAANIAGGRFACSKPNIQPEDKGPDGVFVRLKRGARVDRAHVEIHSVKNSINSPRQLVASGGFRKRGMPKKGKALDDFRRLSVESFGFVRYDASLSQVSSQLGLSPADEIRAGLIAGCGYNVIVVADHAHADVDVFDGYRWLTKLPARHVGTYVGATKWSKVSELTRKSVRKMLKAAGGG